MGPAVMVALAGLFVLSAITMLMLLRGAGSAPSREEVRATATPAAVYGGIAEVNWAWATHTPMPVSPSPTPAPELTTTAGVLTATGTGTVTGTITGTITVIPTTEPEQALLPLPDGPAQTGAGERGQQGDQPSIALTPTVVSPAPKKSGELILPNGVRYGDHRPNLPHRVVRIASPAIKLDASVYEVYVKNGAWEVAEYAAGHHYNSLNPGEGGNIVISGHNNWKGEVFRYLEFLKPGDEIDLWTLEGKRYKYVVQEIKKLKEAGVSYQQRLKNAQVMQPTPYEQLTLITCWPYTTYTHRLVVIARPAP